MAKQNSFQVLDLFKCLTRVCFVEIFYFLLYLSDFLGKINDFLLLPLLQVLQFHVVVHDLLLYLILLLVRNADNPAQSSSDNLDFCRVPVCTGNAYSL